MQPSDGEDAGEWLYEPTNPWFAPLGGSNLVPFVVLSSRLTAIGRALDLLKGGVSAFIETEQGLVDSMDFGDYAPYAGEAEDAISEDLLWVLDVVPLATFGGLLAIVFSALEVTAKEVTEIVEMRTSSRFQKSRGGLIEQHLHFFSETTGQRISPLTPRFVALRKLRNRVIHSLLEEEVSEEEVSEKSPDFPILEVGTSLDDWVAAVHAALQEVGVIATELDEACVRANL